MLQCGNSLVVHLFLQLALLILDCKILNDQTSGRFTRESLRYQTPNHG